MVAVLSTMQELDSAAADFQLPDVTAQNQTVSLADLRDKPLLVMFICNHCPYVIHVMELLVALANEAQEKGFAVVAISSNDVENYPQDGPQPMAEFAQQYGFKFPYLFDESQQVALSYRAACTPDFYLYDRNHRLQYRGQLDSARPGNGHAVTGGDLRQAIEALINDAPPIEHQTPSMGCNIKWRKGNEPEYF